MEWNEIYISDISLSTSRPYIFFVSIPVYSILYIGQVCQPGGIIGIIPQSIEQIANFELKTSCYEVDFNKEIKISAIDLSEYEEFSHTFSRSRTALGFLIYSNIKSKGCNAKVPFEILSDVKANKLINDFKLQDFAVKLSEEACRLIPYFI